MCLRLGGRINAELVLQRSCAGVIDAQSAGAVVSGGVQAHQCAAGGLVQWIDLFQPLGVADGRANFALRFQQGDQPLERGNRHLLQTCAFRQNPIIVATGQQVAAIQARCLLQVSPGGSLGQRRFEGGDIEGIGRIRSPLHRLRIGL